MALLRLTMAMAALLSGLPLLRASEPQPAAREVEVSFVPPGADGTVSLGIYNSSGKLVRVLCDEWPFHRFHVGHDALSATWDGLDAGGKPVPAGTYSARGFIVGNVEVSGEAFHFNDWIDEADSPRIAAVRAQQPLPGGDILLSARLAGDGGALVRYSPESDVRWHAVVATPRTDPAQAVQLAASETLAFVLLDGSLQAVQLADGAAVSPPMNGTGIKAIAARGSRLAILDGGGIAFYTLPDFAPVGNAGQLPADFSSLALLDDGTAVAAASGGSVWIWHSGWSRLDIPDDVLVREVSGGRGATFWARQETPDGKSSIAQYSPEDGRLAEWTPRAEDGRLTSVSGAADDDSFVATLVLPDVQRTVAIRRKRGAEGWEFVFDKKITASSGFGWADGKPVASSSDLPGELAVDLTENPLDASASRRLILRAVASPTGAGLTTRDGLPLLSVSGQPGFDRVMLVRAAAPNAARFFQGDGACVEEYTVSRLDDIVSFDAGTIEMTGSGEAPPPPPEEPPD